MLNKEVPEDDLFHDYCLENKLHQSCPKCNRSYDDIDYDFQSCSKCGWDVEKQCVGEKREPLEADYVSGEADILTGRWNY